MARHGRIGKARKLELFEFATLFVLRDDSRSRVQIEHSGARGNPDANKWAITDGISYCYNNTKESWEYEPLPSSRSARFLVQTRYSLSEAFRIGMKLVRQYESEDNPEGA